MVGLSVTPHRPSSSTSFLSVPSCRYWRRMLSYQKDWPCSASSGSGLVVLSAMSSSVSAADQAAGRLRDVLGREAELLQDHLAGRRGAEVVQADDGARVSYPLPPAERRRRLDRDP